jgi:hypothetical protein
MGVAEIKKNGISIFYRRIRKENLKEVQMNTSSLSFKIHYLQVLLWPIPFIQLVDGMDNASPLLNFVLGLIGVSEIDVQNVGVLPGHLLLCMVQMQL